MTDSQESTGDPAVVAGDADRDGDVASLGALDGPLEDGMEIG